MISSILKFVSEADFTYTHNWLRLRQLWHKFLDQNSAGQAPMQKAVEMALMGNRTVSEARLCMWAA